MNKPTNHQADRLRQAVGVLPRRQQQGIERRKHRLLVVIWVVLLVSLVIYPTAPTVYVWLVWTLAKLKRKTDRPPLYKKSKGLYTSHRCHRYNRHNNSCFSFTKSKNGNTKNDITEKNFKQISITHNDSPH